MKHVIEHSGQQLQQYVLDKGLVWPNDENDSKQTLSLSRAEQKQLESVLLDSDSVHYNAEAIFCQYTDSLKPGSRFLPLEFFSTHAPIELDGAYIVYRDQVEKQLDKLGCSVHDLGSSKEMCKEVCEVLPPQWNTHRKLRCVMAIAAAREHLCYKWDIDRYPLRHPFRPLETALYEAAKGDHAEYLRLATEFNRRAPIPVLYYRKKHVYGEALWK